MTNSEKTRKRELVDDVLAEFTKKRDVLEDLCTKTKSLIEDCLEAAQLRYQSVQSRIKRQDKLREKYLDPAKNYTTLDDITDQAALRVITYYEDEVDQVAALIKKEFKLDADNCIDKREKEPDRFGYHAFNFVCTHADKRTADVQFNKFAGLRFEVQVTSILSHAWSEIEHEWYDLKDNSYPIDIRRRFSRQAALLEIAESEFLSLRNLKRNFSRSIEVRVEANVQDLIICAVSLKTFVLREPIVTQIDKEITSVLGLQPAEKINNAKVELWSNAAKAAGLVTLQRLRQSLIQHESVVIDYVKGSREHWRTRATAKLYSGVCVYHLSMMLLANQGQKKLSATMKDLKIRLSDRIINGQGDVARQIMAAQRNKAGA